MADGVGGDRAEVRLTAEQVCDAGVIADSHTNLLDNILLYDDIAEIEIVPLIPVMPVMPSTHGVEFRIDQFTDFTHDFDPRGVHVNNIWAQSKPVPHCS